MPRFRYRVRDQEGKSSTGIVEAPNKTTAFKLLSEKFDIVTDLDPIKSSNRLLGLLSRGGFGSEDRLLFTEQLAEMLDNGVSLNSALSLILAEDEENVVRNGVVSEILTSVTEGMSLSASLKKHPRYFDPLYLALVAAGEAAGKMPLMLRRLADFGQAREKMRRQVRGALVYPGIVLGVATVLVGVLVLFGIPRVESVYREMGTNLPPLTRLFVHLATILSTNLLLLLTTLVLLGWGIRHALMQPRLYGALNTTISNLPIISTLIRNIRMARFCRTLGTLYSSAVPLGEALDLVANAMDSAPQTTLVRNVKSRVENGEPLATALRQCGGFAPMLVGMIAAGQETGALDRTLDRLAEMYESKVESGIQVLLSVLEPALVVFVGIVIGGLVIVIGMPFLNIASHFGG